MYCPRRDEDERHRAAGVHRSSISCGIDTVQWNGPLTSCVFQPLIWSSKMWLNIIALTKYKIYIYNHAMYDKGCTRRNFTYDWCYTLREQLLDISRSRGHDPYVAHHLHEKGCHRDSNLCFRWTPAPLPRINATVGHSSPYPWFAWRLRWSNLGNAWCNPLLEISAVLRRMCRLCLSRNNRHHTVRACTSE